MSLRLRLALWYCALTGAVVVLVCLYSYAVHSRAHYDELDAMLWGATRHVAGELATATTDEERARILTSARRLGIEVRMYGVDGRPHTLLPMPPSVDVDVQSILAGTPAPAYPGVAALAPALHAVQRRPGAFGLVRGTDRARWRVFALPDTTLDGMPHYLATALPLAHIDASVQQFARLMAAMAVVGCALTFVAGWLVAGRVLRPVAALTESARRIALSRVFSGRVAVGMPRDELGRLAATFNEMLASLEQAYAAQQRFVSDASHELRAPLTVIQANLELLKRHAAMPAEERDQAIQESHQEAARLVRLVADLLVLARADAELWRARPYDELVEHLSTLRAEAAIAVRTESGSAANARDFRRESTVPGDRQRLHVTQDGETCVAPSVPIVPGPALDAFVRRGVPAAGQRYATEFRVAMAFMASPERYPEFGLSATSRSNEEIARALTEWLARHNNSNSAEWNDAAVGGEDRAQAVFLGRYLAQDANRRTIVDRAREALLWERAADRPTVYPGRDAFMTLLEVAVRRFSTTARRWGFVTWCLALQRASRLQALRSSGLGAAMRDGAVVWQIYSVWAKKWPGGSGSYRTDSTGMVQTAYTAYLQVLEEEGLIELVAPHTTPWDAARALRPGIDCHPRHVDSSDPDRIRGECATYRVRLLGSVVPASALPYRPEVLDLATRYAPLRHGKPMSIDEILHAAWAWTARTSVEEHYGARQWKHITALKEALTKASDLLGNASEPTNQLKRAA